MDTENKIMLKGVNVQLLPFDSKYWQVIAQWFYDTDYKDMFRQFTRMLNEDDFKQYNSIIVGEVFIIHSNLDKSVMGMIQVIPCSKKNKAGYIGMVIDKQHQGKRVPTEAMIVFMDYLFNRQGYNKLIMEILESNESLKKTLDKSGFYKEGKLIQECFIDGKFQNELRYSMTSFYFNKNKDKAQQEYLSWVDSSNNQ